MINKLPHAPETETEPDARDRPSGHFSRVDDIDRERVRRGVLSRLFEVEPRPVKVGRYEIIRRLGGGAMGQVHEARDCDLDRRVALKILNPERLELLPEADRVELLREAQALARLSHPNVVQVYEVGIGEEPVFIAMELIEGQNLLHWLEEKRPDWREIIDVFRQAGLGLQAAHDAGIVHRDFKPHNVMLGSGGKRRVCVTDFGLARPVSDAPTLDDGPRGAELALDPATRSGRQWGGTPAYMAPEQFEDVATEASDQFSFCVALYQALYGALPFSAASNEERRVQVERGAPLPSDDRGIPQWVLFAIRSGLALRPEHRHPSMHALLDALDYERRRRRRRLGLGAAGLVLASAVGSYGVGKLMETPEPSCDGFEAIAEGLWNEPLREELERRLIDSDPIQGPWAFARIDGTLDAQLDQWTQFRTQTCVAAREQAVTVDSSAVSSHRMKCLDRRRRIYEGIIDRLPDLEPRELAAAPFVSNPPPFELCMVDDPPQVDEAGPGAEIEAKLAEVETLVGLGRREEAMSILDGLEGSAEGDPWHTAWMEIIRGDLERELGDRKSGRERILAGTMEAERHRYEYIAWAGWLAMADEVRFQSGLEEATVWIALAESANRRLGDLSGQEDRQSKLTILRASQDLFHWRANEKTKDDLEGIFERYATEEPNQIAFAAAHLRLALAIQEANVEDATRWADIVEDHVAKLYGATSPDRLATRLRGDAHLVIGQARNLSCRWEDGVESFTSAVDAWKQVLPADHPDFNHARTGFIQAYIGLARYEQARESAREILESPEKDGLAGASALLSLGLVEFADGRLDDAREHMEGSAALFESEGAVVYAAVARLGLAEMELHRRRFEQAMELLARAAAPLARVRELSEEPLPPDIRGLLHKVTGLVALGEGRVEDAAKDLEVARASYGGGCEVLELADTELALAAVLRRQGKAREAEGLERQARSHYRQHGATGEARQERTAALIGTLESRTEPNG